MKVNYVNNYQRRIYSSPDWGIIRLVTLFMCLIMTSSNGNIFRVTGPLCGEFTGPGEFSAQRPMTRSFDVFFGLRPHKGLIKQPWGWSFETSSWSLWRHYNVSARPKRLSKTYSFMINIAMADQQSLKVIWCLIMWYKQIFCIPILTRSNTIGFRICHARCIVAAYCHSVTGIVLLYLNAVLLEYRSDSTMANRAL